MFLNFMYSTENSFYRLGTVTDTHTPPPHKHTHTHKEREIFYNVVGSENQMKCFSH